MSSPFRFSAIFPRIDDFVLALRALDARGLPIEDYSIEGPPCVLVRSVQHQGQVGNLLAIVCDARSTEELVGERTIQLGLADLGLQPGSTDTDIGAVWSGLKAKHPFLERTELFLRNRHNFGSAFVANNRHWFAG